MSRGEPALLGAGYATFAVSSYCVTLFAADADGLLLASGFVIFHLHYHSGRIEAGLL